MSTFIKRLRLVKNWLIFLNLIRTYPIGYKFGIPVHDNKQSLLVVKYLSLLTSTFYCWSISFGRCLKKRQKT